MQYLRGDTRPDTPRTGAVWSPGPVANSLWLIDDETGEFVAVKFPRGRVDCAYDFHYVLPVLDRDDWAGVKWLHGPRQQARWGWEPAPATPAIDYRYAPKLSEKVWRAAVGDQCEQLELTAA